MKGFQTGQNLSVLIPKVGGKPDGNVEVGSLNIAINVTWGDHIKLSPDLVNKAQQSIMESAAAAYAELDKRLAEES